MAVMKIQQLVLRRLVLQDSSSVPMGAACHQAMCVMPKMTAGTTLTSLLKHAVGYDMSAEPKHHHYKIKKNLFQ